MRPVELKMTAFGSYAEETVIPFIDLSDDLYLVTGDTGAGKTTIFDAIMFALYGAASGTDRNAMMLHCDHVPKSTDTSVKLRFLQGGKEYCVERSIHFQKKRGKTEEFGEGRIDALLREPDSEPLKGASAVTARCTEILGLNADQFRKIIMLAQGEFMQFLRSDSGGKMDILSKLFDNARYVYYQDLFIGARDSLGSKRRIQSDRLRSLMENSFVCPESADSSKFIAGDPELESNIRELLEKEKEVFDQLKEKCAGIDEKITRLNTAKGAAEEINGQLDELKSQKEKLESLGSKEPEFEERKKRRARIEKIVHSICPAKSDLERVVKNMEANSNEISDLESRTVALNDDLIKAREVSAADDELRKAAEKLGVEITNLRDQMPLFDVIDNKTEEMKAAETAAKKAGADKKAEEDEAFRIEGEIVQCKEGLTRLDGIDAQAGSLENIHNDVKKKYDILTGREGISEEIESISEDIIALEEDKRKLADLTEAAREAENKYHSLYQSFINGQAGILADSLRSELDSEGSALCPVCGSHVVKGDEERFAPLSSDTPLEKEVSDARADSDQKEKKRGDKNTEVMTAEAKLGGRKTAVVKRLCENGFSCESWEELCEEGFLSDLIRRTKEELEDVHQKLNEAKNKVAVREALRKKLPELEKDLEQKKEEVRVAEEAEKKQNDIAREIAIEIREKRRQLIHNERKQAETDLSEKEREKTSIEDTVKKHEADIKSIQDALLTAESVTKEKKNAQKQLEKEKEKASESLEKQILKCGFKDLYEADELLGSIGDHDHEEWLTEENDEINRYYSDLQSTKNQVDSLEKRMLGKEYTDIRELEESLEKAGEEKTSAYTERSNAEKLVENHKMILDGVSDIHNELAATEEAWTRVSRLADLAEGSSGEGGKLSFDRYVMGAIFREILDMANMRMEQISGGRYELVHKLTTKRSNSKAGLEIEVLDNATGLQRSSDSLSGGEKFFTSMSLALGLADVVQNHAGGRQMESMFIDEGFGTLSDDVLDSAITVLNQLTQGSRLVGVISHVDKLSESIPQKIRVHNSGKGSTVTIEV